MARNDRNRFLSRSTQALQTSVERAGPAAAASYSLIGSVILLGGLGYGCDRWFGTWPWGMVGGLMLGILVGFYLLAKAVWLK
jgi:F0F1-type ATP synthase assembly protein I